MYYSTIIVPLIGIEDENQAFELHAKILTAIHSVPDTGTLIERLDIGEPVGEIAEATANEVLRKSAGHPSN